MATSAVVDQEIVTLAAREDKKSGDLLDQLRLEVEKLRASREGLVRAADADRRRIERELHDGPQQDLAALVVKLQLARRRVDVDPSAAGALLDEIAQDVRDALERTRTLADRIYPPLLETGGLGVALRSAAASAGVRTVVEVTMGAACPPEVAGTVYFCCVAVLAQAGTEARSRITVGEEHSAVVFEISANGPESGSIGPADFARLEEQVEALGGRLTIAALPRQGIRVSGSLPISS